MDDPIDEAAMPVSPAARVDSADAGPIRRVLLGTDLTAVSGRAADEAIALAARHHAQLIVISVLDTNLLRLPGGRFLRRVDQERARIEAGAQELVSRAREAGAAATFLVWEGDPAEAVLEAAAAESVDVIVLGSHGRGRVGRMILGSTSKRVTDGARCPVLVVRA